MKKEWVSKSIDEKQILNLPEYPALILRLLAQRGLSSEQEMKQFFNPDYNNLLDPFLFQDMTKAVDRIKSAIDGKEKICIYADYDADAITALSVVYLCLKNLGVNADYYIPDRFSEGYGMNQEAIKKIAAQGVKLIITVDCATNSVEEAKLAKSLGIDMIITDHHEITSDQPQVLALINPKNSKDNYPFRYLTGVGVAFKLVQALMPPHDQWSKWLLDLVAIGTVADLQPLTSENRLLVHFGLKVLPKTRWLGLHQLTELANIKSNRSIDTYTLGFLLAPRINAAGRIRHGELAFQLLISESEQEAGQLAKELDELNTHRQTLTDQILSEAKAQVETNLEKKVLVAYGENWPKGVVGLVAGKLTELYNRPSLVIEKDEASATGSARSISGYNVVEALKYSKDLLQKFGGHAEAAGFSLESKNIEAFHQRLLEYAEQIGYELSPPEIRYDSEVSAKDLTWEIYEYLAKFAPFGMGNPRPRFMAKNFKLIEGRQVGSDNQHLKMKVSLGEKEFGAIAFGKGFFADILNMSTPFDAVFELEANEWNGNRELQLKIIDIKNHE